MNELINHKAVYRTAPATPGLLIKGTHTLSFFSEGIKHSFFLIPSIICYVEIEWM